MKQQPSYREHDYAFGQTMLTLRSTIGLTQTALADTLGVSRRTVGDWESGGKYPKPEHLRAYIVLAAQQGAFPAGREADAIRALWKASHQRVLLDEVWLATLFTPTESAKEPPLSSAVHPPISVQTEGEQARRSYGFPFQPTNFIGRGAELNEIARLLRDPACRLLTLIGPGGVGKTRLALAAAAGHADAYADGAAFVSLAPVGSPNQIISAIANALELSFGSETDPAARLLAWLRGRHMLLVLDNFEHLLDGAELVYDILERAPRVIILITSRERLNLSAEWLFDVQGLSYPPVDSSGAVPSLSLASVSVFSAVQLFIQRLMQVQPGYVVNEAALRTIVNICQRVVGMPLAIELAVAGVRAMTLADIDRHISSNLDMLATTLRDVPARHRSLRAVFDHSWNLLSAPEHAPFTRLGVFRGGFTAAAAEQVAGASLPMLMTLVDKSLVRQAPVPAYHGGGNVPRFLMLEPIREYALEKLSEQGEAETLRRAHALYYLALAEAADAQWETPTAEAALGELERELDNLRAVLQWAVSGGDAQVGLQLAGRLMRFWRNRAHRVEGRQWLKELLVVTKPNSDPADLSSRIRATQAAAWIAADQHDFTDAAELFEQSRVFRLALGETADETNLLINGALEARAAGQYQRATILFQDALARQRAMGDRGTLSSGGFGYVLYFLAHTLREQGDYDSATALYEESVEFHASIGDRDGMTQSLLGLSDIARDRGDVVLLRSYCNTVLPIYREIGTHWALGFCLNNLALGAYLEGELDEALELISESISIFRAQKAEGSVAEVLVTLGAVLRARGDFDGAYNALAESLRLGWVSGLRLLIAAALECLGGVLISRGDVRMTVRCLAAAALMREQMGAPLRPSDQLVYRHTLAEAQATLGANAFDVAWAEAQRLPPQQIISALVDGA